MNSVLFYIFAAIIVIFSIMSVTSRRILRAAVYLLFVLLATAGFYFLLDYHFLAAVQFTLYAGGIVVLIIFSILLTSPVTHKFKHPSARNLLAGIGVSIIGLAISLISLYQYVFTPGTNAPIVADMREIGLQLTNYGRGGYALPFEAISVLLLAAMIGAIIIAKKGKVDSEKEKA